MSAADEQEERVAQRREERARAANITSGMPTIAARPDHQELGGLQPQVGAGELARQVRPEVATLDDAVEAVERLALCDQLRRLRPGRSPSSCEGRLVSRRRTARAAPMTSNRADDAMPNAISTIASGGDPGDGECHHVHAVAPRRDASR